MKILIISEYIAPLQAIASVRWTKIAKYMKQQHPDVKITVLTNKKDYKPGETAAQYVRKDELLEKELRFFDEYWEIPQDFFLKIYDYLKDVRNKDKTVFYAQKKTTPMGSFKESIGGACLDVVHDTKDRLWERQIRKHLPAQIFDSDIIISTYGPFWTHMIANYLKRKKSNIIWLADFRDFYASDNNSPSAYKRHQRYSMKYCATADIIMRVMDELETFTPSHVPIYTISNGFDPQDCKKPQPPAKFSVVYTGSLYGKKSDIGIAHKALCELCQEHNIDGSDVEFIYAGQYGEMAKALIEYYHPEEIFLRNLGLIPRTEALDLQLSSAILLQTACNLQKEKALWTGKMYEYMMAKKPILYVDSGTVPHSGPSKNIHRLGGCCYEQSRHGETYPQMKAYILEKYQEWKATGNVSVQQDKKYIEQYSYPHIAEQVWQLIQMQMERRKSGEDAAT